MMRELRAYLVAAMCLMAAFPAQAAEGRLQTTSTKPTASATPTDGPAALSPQDARAVRSDLEDVMKRYPPQLGRVLALDGTLTSNPGFMASYPALQAFLAAHPDVAKNPSFYFSQYSNEYQPENPEQRLVEDTLGGLLGFTIFATVMAVVTWIVRTIVDYRRWHRLVRVQAEAHTKLLDRFTANDELIAYVQSPAGRQFLESAPIALDPGTRRLGAPVSRILWSAQAGLVILMAGIAFQVVSKQVDYDASQPLVAIGVVGVFVGIGFLLSAAVAYVLSRHLKLFEPSAAGPATTPRPEA